MCSLIQPVRMGVKNSDRNVLFIFDRYCISKISSGILTNQNVLSLSWQWTQNMKNVSSSPWVKLVVLYIWMCHSRKYPSIYLLLLIIISYYYLRQFFCSLPKTPEMSTREWRGWLQWRFSYAELRSILGRKMVKSPSKTNKTEKI